MSAARGLFSAQQQPGGLQGAGRRACVLGGNPLEAGLGVRLQHAAQVEQGLRQGRLVQALGGLGVESIVGPRLALARHQLPCLPCLAQDAWPVARCMLKAGRCTAALLQLQAGPQAVKADFVSAGHASKCILHQALNRRSHSCREKFASDSRAMG